MIYVYPFKCVQKMTDVKLLLFRSNNYIYRPLRSRRIWHKVNF